VLHNLWCGVSAVHLTGSQCGEWKSCRTPMNVEREASHMGDSPVKATPTHLRILEMVSWFVR